MIASDLQKLTRSMSPNMANDILFYLPFFYNIQISSSCTITDEKLVIVADTIWTFARMSLERASILTLMQQIYIMEAKKLQVKSFTILYIYCSLVTIYIVYFSFSTPSWL